MLTKLDLFNLLNAKKRNETQRNNKIAPVFLKVNRWHFLLVEKI